MNERQRFTFVFIRLHGSGKGWSKMDYQQQELDSMAARRLDTKNGSDNE
jgi:uncharacterized protein YecE (DUF72 family)